MDERFAYRITVFTPTYNRAYILENLYRSLQRQRFRDFEWLVVDDGSTDGTEALVNAWAEAEKSFAIRCLRQPNGGKCRAINRGLENARGELFFTVDSDDYLTDDALEKADAWERALPKDGKFCGMVANRGTAPDKTPNTIYPGEYFDGDLLDFYRKGIDGERAFIFYTKIHRMYLYPEFPGENFMTEAVTWNRMANDGYRVRFYNDIIWIWEYQEDGLTRKGYDIFLKNPRGTALWFREKADFLHYSFRTRLGMWYGYVCDAYPMRSDREIAEDIAMPLPLVAPMRWLHALLHILRGKKR